LEERRRRRAIAAKAADHSSDYRGGQNLGVSSTVIEAPSCTRVSVPPAGPTSGTKLPILQNGKVRPLFSSVGREFLCWLISKRGSSR
jgi:hypothetical protein